MKAPDAITRRRRDASILKMYRDTSIKVSFIAAHHSVAPSLVARICRKAGLRPRPQGIRPRSRTRSSICRLWGEIVNSKIRIGGAK